MIIIRNQDREAVGKYVEVKIDENVIKGFGQFGSVTVLGAYESRETAIKVLNCIHKFIEVGPQKDYLDGKYRIKQEMIFNMPMR